MILSNSGIAAPPQYDFPVVLVFQLADTDAGRGREQRFVTELKLALDRFSVLSVKVAPSFNALSLAERLKSIRSLSKAHRAAATLWLETADDGTVLLNLVAMSTGRALVRIVEVASGPATEPELAFAAQELLGEAYLFSPRQHSAAVNDEVDSVRQSVIEMRPEKEPTITAGIMPLFETSGAVFRRNGPSLAVGGGLAVELDLSSAFFFRSSITGRAGPRKKYDDGLVSGFGVNAKIQAGYLFRLGHFRIGPSIGGGVEWHRLETAFGDGDSQPFSWVAFRGDISLDIQLKVRKLLYLVLTGGIGGLSVRKYFRRVSDNSILVETPFVDWHAALGFLFVL